MPHGHHHHGAEGGDGKLALAVGVNLLLTVAQVIGGIVSGSLAMIADALHNFSDAASLIIAAAARRIARRPADEDMTFGYGRAELVAALINLTTLIVIGLYLLYEAVFRLIAPEPVTGWLIIVIAAVALVVDLATAALTWAMSKDSVNIRAAFLHNVADAMGSLAVIVAGLLIMWFGWMWVDPVATLGIAGYILWMAFAEIGGVIRILMLGSPPDLAADHVIATAEGVPGVKGMHHAHLWQLDEHRRMLEAHIVIAAGEWGQADAIKQAVKDAIEGMHGIGHVTLEMECAGHECAHARAVGH